MYRIVCRVFTGCTPFYRGISIPGMSGIHCPMYLRGYHVAYSNEKTWLKRDAFPSATAQAFGQVCKDVVSDMFLGESTLRQNHDKTCKLRF